jgi:hypothetical protein
MGTKKLGGSAAAGKSPDKAKAADHSQAADHGKQVRAFFKAYHRGKRETALRQLEEHAEVHPSGLACQALLKLHVLEGLREALKVRGALLKGPHHCACPARHAHAQ